MCYDCITCWYSNTEITGAGQILTSNLACYSENIIFFFSFLKIPYIFTCENISLTHFRYRGEQWLSGRVLVSRLRVCGFEPHLRCCIVSLSKTLYPVQPRKT